MCIAGKTKYFLCVARSVVHPCDALVPLQVLRGQPQQLPTRTPVQLTQARFVTLQWVCSGHRQIHVFCIGDYVLSSAGTRVGTPPQPGTRRALAPLAHAGPPLKRRRSIGFGSAAAHHLDKGRLSRFTRAGAPRWAREPLASSSRSLSCALSFCLYAPDNQGLLVCVCEPSSSPMPRPCGALGWAG